MGKVITVLAWAGVVLLAVAVTHKYAALDRADRMAPLAAAQASTAPDAGARHPKVVMFSASWCSNCRRAKAYFDAHHIAYQDYDVEHSKQAWATYKKLHGIGVPLILVGGQRMDGFSVAGFQKLYH